MLESHHISVSYQRGVKAVNNISFEFNSGQIIGVIGPNGAGKSTLIKAMLNLIPHEGNSLLDNKYISDNARKVAYVQQKSSIDLTFPITVGECVALGLQAHSNIFGISKLNEKKEIAEALGLVSMLEYSQRQIGQLSGGQFQRVLIARCLVQKADLIVLDEPFVGIDARSEKAIISVLRKLRSEGKTILIVHHDLKTVKSYFNSLLIMNKSLIAYGPVSTTFNERNLGKAYGIAINSI